MANHKQPTKEELKEQEYEAIRAVEELEGKQQIPQDEDPEVVTPPDEEGDTQEEPPEETPQEEPVVEEVTEEAEPSKELYKKKFSASSREAQKIAAKNRVINQALTDADDIPEPTDEELSREFTDWDLMSDVEKTLAKETVISRKWRQVISSAKEQATKIEKWNDSVEEFVDDPKTLIDNPDLEGKTDEFKTFATQEANNSVPFKILVSAFLHDSTSGKVPNKGRMFERGSGGPNDKPIPKSDKLTLEEGRKLRETNYDLWREKLSQGKIEPNL